LLSEHETILFFFNFQDFDVCFLGNFANEVPKFEIELIIKRLGGQVFRNLADLSASRRQSRTRLMIVDSTRDPNPEVKGIFATSRVAVVSKDWILDSVGAFQTKTILPYVQGEVDVEDLTNTGYSV
jgi:hypothetical protein